jgi:hypothetical protein
MCIKLDKKLNEIENDARSTKYKDSVSRFLIFCCSRKFDASKFIAYVMHSVYFMFCVYTRRADNFMDGKNVCFGNAVSAVRHPTCVPLFRNVYEI